MCVRVFLPQVLQLRGGKYLIVKRSFEALRFSSPENAHARFVTFNRHIISPIDILICLILQHLYELCLATKRANFMDWYQYTVSMHRTVRFIIHRKMKWKQPHSLLCSLRKKINKQEHTGDPLVEPFIQSIICFPHWDKAHSDITCSTNYVNNVTIKEALWVNNTSPLQSG